MYKFGYVLISKRELDVHLLLNMYDFNVILGIDWSSTFHASIECFGHRVVFRIPGD